MSEVKQHIVKNRDGTITLGTTQDVSEILKQNQYEAQHNINKGNKDGFGTKVASIPLNLINLWCKEWGITMQQLMNDPTYKAKMMARLNDRDYLKLRTDYGRV